MSHFVVTFVAPFNDLVMESRRASTPNDTCGCYSHCYWCLVCLVDLRSQLVVSKQPVYFIRLRSGILDSLGVRPALIKSRLEVLIISSYRNNCYYYFHSCHHQLYFCSYQLYYYYHYYYFIIIMLYYYYHWQLSLGLSILWQILYQKVRQVFL